MNSKSDIILQILTRKLHAKMGKRASLDSLRPRATHLLYGLKDEIGNMRPYARTDTD